MKRILGVLSTAALFGGGIVAAQEAMPKNNEINILLWGASGCGGISHMLPEMAKDIGQTVHVRVLSRSFNRYPVAIRAAEAGKRAPDGIDPGTLPDKGAEHGYVNLEKDRSILLDDVEIGIEGHLAGGNLHPSWRARNCNAPTGRPGSKLSRR